MRKNIFLAIAMTALALSACSGDAALQEVSKQGTEANKCTGEQIYTWSTGKLCHRHASQ